LTPKRTFRANLEIVSDGWKADLAADCARGKRLFELRRYCGAEFLELWSMIALLDCA
jgi:hypothetical protein